MQLDESVCQYSSFREARSFVDEELWTQHYQSGLVNICEIQRNTLKNNGFVHSRGTHSLFDILLSKFDRHIKGMSGADNGLEHENNIDNDAAQPIDLKDKSIDGMVNESDSLYENSSQITRDRDGAVEPNNLKEEGRGGTVNENGTFYENPPQITKCLGDERNSDKEEYEYVDMMIQEDDLSIEQYQGMSAAGIGLEEATITSISDKMNTETREREQESPLGTASAAEKETTLKSHVKDEVMLCLTQNEKISELIKLANCEGGMQSLVSEITDVCLRVSLESSLNGAEKLDEKGFGAKIAEEKNTLCKETDPLSSPPGKDMQLRAEFPSKGIDSNLSKKNFPRKACTGCMHHTGVANKSVGRNINDGYDDDYDYAYATRQCSPCKQLSNKESQVMVATDNKTLDENPFHRRENLQKRPEKKRPDTNHTGGNDETKLETRLQGFVSNQTTDRTSYVSMHYGTQTISKELCQSNATDTSKTSTPEQPYPIEDDTLTAESSCEVKKSGSSTLMNWALEHGLRRVQKSKYNAKDDKVYVHSYDEIDSVLMPKVNTNSRCTFRHNLKLKCSICFLVIVVIATVTFLLIFIPKMK